MNEQPIAHPLLAAAPWLRDTATMKVFDVLERAGYQGRAVGGTVRNTLLGEPISDIDMATDATPEQVTLAAQRAGLRVLPTGIAHGTVTIIVKGKPFEVTTLRKDVSTDGRRATVAGSLAGTHFHEDQCATGLAQDQVDLAAAAPRRPIIAFHKHQPGLQQVRQRLVFGRGTGLPRGRPSRQLPVR